MPIQTQQIPIGGKLTSTRPQQLSTAELSALYDRIYDIADRLFKKHNPCNIHTKNNKVFCLCYNEKWNKGKGKKLLCCSGCVAGYGIDNPGNYWSDEGCITKCLPCKLYLCPEAKRMNKRLSNQLYKLKQFARKHGLPNETNYYMSKEEWFKLRSKTW
jgi:hypothetical protein